jgi:alpha-glucosidase
MRNNKFIRRTSYLCIILFTFVYKGNGQNFTLTSPNKVLSSNIQISTDVSFSVTFNSEQLVSAQAITMELDIGTPGGFTAVLKNHKESHFRDKIKAPFSTKSSIIDDDYNLLVLNFEDNYTIEFRAYDQGFAYRFVTHIEEAVIVRSETVDLDFGKEANIYFPEEESFISHSERDYIYTTVEEIEVNKFCSLPFLVESVKGPKVLFTESDLDDYPGLFMQKSAGNKVSAIFPKYVLKTGLPSKGADRNEVIVEEANYIARSIGKRSFPWRVFIIGEDKDLFESTLSYQLASPCVLEDTKWINPGQVAWDWYNANNLFQVDFKSGLNTKTYKYYIDFASENSIEYIILDEGWSASTTNIIRSSDMLDVEELIDYGKDKGVGIILWVLWKPLNQDIPGILGLYQKWGAAGIKVDFMQRADQHMVNFYKNVAREAANHKLLVDFHGAFKPAGLHREYPNVLTFEGLKGNEHNKWSQDITPDYNLTIPFIRMVAGPIDYTPGSMSNAQKVNHHVSFQRPVSLGTRCHELSKYVIFESPLQMLCDAPSRYRNEQETVDFITSIPQVWDETRVLEAKISDYLLVARRKGEDWYLAAMTDWTSREFHVKLDFLSEGDYRIQIMQDGINANTYAEDYKLIERTISNNETVSLTLAKGGGWVAILSKL